VAIDWDLARDGIYRITDQIFVGQYPKADAFLRLQHLGITTILNVSGGVYDHPRLAVVNVPVQDLVELPLPTADKIVETIVGVVTRGERIYVHCIAGQNRSPGSVFLGLLALGIGREQAARLIEESTLDAVAHHEAIITERVIGHVLGRAGGRLP
jgi:hypothetical protein